MQIQPQTILTKSPDALTSPVKDGLAMMDVQSGNYYGLDDIETKTWALIDSQRTLGEICDLLIETYDVSREQCWEDVSKWVGQLAKNKLVNADKMLSSSDD
jgi:hypothetical protein